MTKRPKPAVPIGGDKDATEFRIVIGKKVREARLKNGLTLAQQAEKAGMAPSYLFEVEVEGTNMTIDVFYKIAVSLGVAPRDLLPGGSGSATSTLLLSLLQSLEKRHLADQARHMEEARTITKLRQMARSVGLQLQEEALAANQLPENAKT